jgi:hypothetical protein
MNYKSRLTKLLNKRQNLSRNEEKKMKLFLVKVTGFIDNTSLQVGKSKEQIIQEIQEEFTYHGNVTYEIKIEEIDSIDGYAIELKKAAVLA